MSRIPKKYITTPFFHIMIQGINKEFIFNTEEDINKYLKIVKEANDKIDINIVAYCIMCNHVHLLIYTENINNLIEFMHKTNLRYAKYYNKKHNRVGYVFRDRYKTQPVFSEKHLVSCIDYIHRNPVKAKICKNPSEYQYSSYNENQFINQSALEINIRNYIESRKPSKENEQEFELVEINDKIDKQYLCERIVKNFLLKNNIEQLELKHKKSLVIKLLKELRENEISYRIIEKELGISRETLRIIDKNIK